MPPPKIRDTSVAVRPDWVTMDFQTAVETVVAEYEGPGHFDLQNSVILRQGVRSRQREKR